MSNPIHPPPLASIPFLWDPHPSSEADLRQALLCAAAELQSTRLAAHEELRQIKSQAIQLSHLLDTAIRERDELQHQCHTLLLLLSSHPRPHPTSDTANSTEEDESSNGELLSYKVVIAVMGSSTDVLIFILNILLLVIRYRVV
jgi:Protein of unknown function (DUF1635)